MNKREIAEIKKLFTKERCCINRLAGCYVDAEKNKVLKFREAFLSLPEEEMYKYLDIFRKALSGTIGKNLINMEFPLEQEMGEGTQKSLLALRDSGLQEDVILESFYDRIIETWYHPENYLILLIHGSYDIPMKTSDGLEMEDASEYVYDFVLCCLCPVALSKAGALLQRGDQQHRGPGAGLAGGYAGAGVSVPGFSRSEHGSAQPALFFKKCEGAVPGDYGTAAWVVCSRLRLCSRRSLSRLSLRRRWERNVSTMWSAISMKI